jgi:hypothetical protein
VAKDVDKPPISATSDDWVDVYLLATLDRHGRVDKARLLSLVDAIAEESSRLRAIARQPGATRF